MRYSIIFGNILYIYDLNMILWFILCCVENPKLVQMVENGTNSFHPPDLFYTSWKHQKNLTFNAFRREKKRSMAWYDRKVLVMCRSHCTKMKFFNKDFFSKCDEIHKKLLLWTHLRKKYLRKTSFFFCSAIRVFPNN